MDLGPAYKYIEKVRREVQWYMTETKDFISNISFVLGNEVVKYHSTVCQYLSIYHLKKFNSFKLREHC